MASSTLSIWFSTCWVFQSRSSIIHWFNKVCRTETMPVATRSLSTILPAPTTVTAPLAGNCRRTRIRAISMPPRSRPLYLTLYLSCLALVAHAQLSDSL
ncbi:hypothetical protein PsYK624_106480 [Phanerochaete sordida]|uniref:Uncharacterized protein n=1 Tax=Phanerochaete sordida TaxID=48140 RepID=A0A9P3GGG4_9APHY|nr:hypothetical protein PsYK624_106480 [Phanerochaete sordida]